MENESFQLVEKEKFVNMDEKWRYDHFIIFNVNAGEPHFVRNMNVSKTLNSLSIELIVPTYVDSIYWVISQFGNKAKK